MEIKLELITHMNLSEIKQLLDAEYLWDSKNDPEIAFIMGSDMMSDVLAHTEPRSLLVTGLISTQTVRTADVADIAGVIYVRGKLPDRQTIDLATELGIPLLSTKLGMFDVCGILHSSGLKGAC